MLFPLSTSDPAPVPEGNDEDMGFALPPVLAEEKEEPKEESKEEPKEEPKESAPRPQSRRKVITRVCQNIFNGKLSLNVLVMGLFALKGNKKLAVEEKPDVASSSSSNVTNRTSEGRSLPLKARYGINAWKRWALSPPDQSDDTKAQESSKAGILNPFISHLPCSVVTLRVQVHSFAGKEKLIVLLGNIKKHCVFANISW